MKKLINASSLAQPYRALSSLVIRLIYKASFLVYLGAESNSLVAAFLSRRLASILWVVLGDLARQVHAKDYSDSFGSSDFLTDFCTATAQLVTQTTSPRLEKLA